MMKDPHPTRAILAGAGQLPNLLLQAAPAHLVRFQGVAIDATSDHIFDARFEQLGTLFETLADADVTEVCLAGAMGRPALDPDALDYFTMAQMPKLMAAMGQGDDALLRTVISVIEEAGFTVLAAHAIRPDLVAGQGVLAGTMGEAADIARAHAVLDALGPLDVGQGAVAARGQIIGVETLQGTDAMLSYVGQTAPASGGVLVKRPKAGQDLRVDMPAIGPDTIHAAARAGLSGIEIAAGHVLLLDREGILEACAQTGLSLWAAP